MPSHGATNEPGAGKAQKAPENQESATAPGTNVSGQRSGAATNEPGAAKAANGSGEAEETGRWRRGAAGSRQLQGRRGAECGPAAAAVQLRQLRQPAKQNAQANAGGKAKKPDPQQVQQIKTQHANFRAQPKPEQVPAVTFNQNYRIEGSDQWQGPQYEVFRSYHPERHDQGWYHRITAAWS